MIVNIWRKQQEVGSHFMRHMLVWIAQHLGRHITYLILYPIVLYFMFFARTARRASNDYLQRVLGRKPTWLEQYRHFLCFAICSIDRVYFLSGKAANFQIKVHGSNVFEPYQQQKRGVLLALAHMGSFDVLRVVAAHDLHAPLKILLSRSQTPGANTLLEMLKPEFVSQVIDADRPATELVLEIQQALNEGYYVAVMADRAGVQDTGVTVPFLGSPAAFPAYPWQISSILDVPVIMCQCSYVNSMEYDIRFELLSTGGRVPPRQRQAVITANIVKFTDCLQQGVMRYPYNWFNFYPFWQNDPTCD